jgi:uncharacterized ferredoxin-like protein
MFIDSHTAEFEAALSAAKAICAAVRTAPKACGLDHLDSAILTGEDKDRVTAKMREIGAAMGKDGAFFTGDAENVDASHVLVLIGAKYEPRHLGKMC